MPRHDDAAKPVGVFVYGTLKRGERNFPVARRAGWIASQLGWIEGYQLRHLPKHPGRPYPYPAVIFGQGRVYGELQRFRSLESALPLLDELECEGREYRRVIAPVQLTLPGQNPAIRRRAWLYQYLNPAELERQAAQRVAEGSWSERVQGEDRY